MFKFAEQLKQKFMRRYKISAGNSNFTVSASSFSEALEKINLEFDLKLTEKDAVIISVIAVD